MTGFYTEDEPAFSLLQTGCQLKFARLITKRNHVHNAKYIAVLLEEKKIRSLCVLTLKTLSISDQKNLENHGTNYASSSSCLEVRLLGMHLWPHI